jgi:hypothetical protein
LPAKASPLGEFNLIHARPATRSEVGHLEGDLIIGSFNRFAIATVFDRASRHLWLAEFPAGHDADETLAAVGEIIDRVPEPLRRSLTWDRGRETARHHDLTELDGIDVYFADPHSPWQRRPHPPLCRQRHQPQPSIHRRPPSHRTPHQHHPPPQPRLVNSGTGLRSRCRDDRLNSPCLDLSWSSETDRAASLPAGPGTAQAA